MKWGADGTVDFVSPLPSPFNYGSVPDTLSEDGDPLDALLVGPRRPAGYRASVSSTRMMAWAAPRTASDRRSCSRSLSC